MKTVLLARHKPVIGRTLIGFRFNNGGFEEVTTSTIVEAKWQQSINAWLAVTASGSNYFVVVNLP